jgi:DNA modification methylase
MGKKWDYDVPSVDIWLECLRVLKPGGHLLSFAGSRTYHRIACAIEDAGFEIRDQIMWVYGSGFPKSLDIGKAIDKVNGEGDRLLKFTRWMRTTGMKPSEATNILRSTGAISPSGTMAGHFFAKDTAGQPAIPTAELWAKLRPHITIEIPAWVDELVERIEAEREVVGKTAGTSLAVAPGQNSPRPAVVMNLTVPATPEAKQWDGWGTALKPAHEPICVARKPISEPSIAANVLKWGTGAINIDGCRVEGNPVSVPMPTGGTGNIYGFKNGVGRNGEMSDNSRGRFPANFIHDGSDEVLAGFPESNAGKTGRATIPNNPIKLQASQTVNHIGHNDSGSAARFFYCAKASKAERNMGCEGMMPVRDADRAKDDGAGGNNPRNRSNNPKQNHHPTVKPLALMRYLVRLVTPPNGTVLDPFLGSGTTAIAAIQEGFDWIGIEREAEYCDIARARIAAAEPQQIEVAL